MSAKKVDPLVTVYITNHNYEKFLEKSINSVLEQTYKNYELIIIDDGSTDGSFKILDKYKYNKKIKIIFQRNKGLNITNNIALKIAKGDFITRLDADDWLDKNFLQVMINEVKNNLNIGMVFCNYYVANAAGEIIDQFFRHDFKKTKLLDQPAHGACSLINTKCLRLVGGYNIATRSQDGVDVWIKFIFKYKIKHINLPLFYYRQHGCNLTKNEVSLLKSRDQIFRDNIKKNKNIIKNVLCIIPIRGRNEDSIALKKINSKTVLGNTLKEILKVKQIKKIIVSSPDKKIINYVKDKSIKKVTAIPREESLSGYNVSINKTLKSIFNKIKKKKKFDAILKINIDHPFLGAGNFLSAINLMNIYKTNEVIAVKKEIDNFFFHNGNGLISINKSQNLTLERDEVYRQIGSLHLYKKNYFQSSERRSKIGHLILDEKSSFHVKSKLDFEICKFLSKSKL
jgi:glycosyltransferase involved in cell wall biosynthesis